MELKKNTTNGSDKTFLTILSGKFHQRVEEGTEGAVERKYKRDLKDDKGKVTGEEEVTVHELIFTEASGMITNMYFQKGNYGRNLIVEIDNDGTISFNASQSYGEQLLRKLPNIDLSKPVSISPYNFTKNGKSNKGVTVIQDGEKLQDYYFDYEAKKSINGLPEPKVKSDGTVNWTIYFETVREFLEEQVQPIFEANGFKAPEKEDTSDNLNVSEVNNSDDDF